MASLCFVSAFHGVMVLLARGLSRARAEFVLWFEFDCSLNFVSRRFVRLEFGRVMINIPLFYSTHPFIPRR